jgi:hypothetical protein
MPSHESSMRNLAKARAKWRPPRPWRSSDESRMIPHSCGTPLEGKGRPVVTGLGNLGSATRGFRNSFGNFKQTRAKCGGFREPTVTPDLRNSAVLRSAVSK